MPACARLLAGKSCGLQWLQWLQAALDAERAAVQREKAHVATQSSELEARGALELFSSEPPSGLGLSAIVSCLLLPAEALRIQLEAKAGAQAQREAAA